MHCDFNPEIQEYKSKARWDYSKSLFLFYKKPAKHIQTIYPEHMGSIAGKNKERCGPLRTGVLNNAD